MQQVGGSLGLGVLVTVFGTSSRNAAHHPQAGLSAVAQQHHQFAHAIATSFTGSAVFLASTFIVIVFAIRSRPAAAMLVLTAEQMLVSGWVDRTHPEAPYAEVFASSTVGRRCLVTNSRQAEIADDFVSPCGPA